MYCICVYTFWSGRRWHRIHWPYHAPPREPHYCNIACAPEPSMSPQKRRIIFSLRSNMLSLWNFRNMVLAMLFMDVMNAKDGAAPST